MRRILTISSAIIAVLVGLNVLVSKFTPSPQTCITLEPLSYEAIKEHIESITKTPEHPDGPEVGDDGIVDPDIRKALGAYQHCLVDKKVENWNGWLAGENTMVDGRFNVPVYIKQPEPGTGTHAEVLIVQVPPEDIRNWDLPSKRAQIIFSGTIAGILSDATVDLRDVTVQPVP